MGVNKILMTYQKISFAETLMSGPAAASSGTRVRSNTVRSSFYEFENALLQDIVWQCANFKGPIMKACAKNFFFNIFVWISKPFRIFLV